jgi:DNA topoisomerase-1
VETVSIERAAELLAERRAKGPAPKKTTTPKKTTAPKKTATRRKAAAKG